LFTKEISVFLDCLDNEEMYKVNPQFEELAKEKGFYSQKLMDKIAKKRNIQGFSVIKEHAKCLLSLANQSDVCCLKQS
jgi:ribonucleoside-diphosphate reductase alpha chain